MNTQNKKQFEPVKLTLSKEVVMVLNGQIKQNNSTTNQQNDDTENTCFRCVTSNEVCGLLQTYFHC